MRNIIAVICLCLVQTCYASEIRMIKGDTVTGEVSFLSFGHVKVNKAGGVLNLWMNEIQEDSFVNLLREKQSNCISSNNFLCISIQTPDGPFVASFETNNVGLKFRRIYKSENASRVLTNTIAARIHGPEKTLPQEGSVIIGPPSLIGSKLSSVIGKYGAPKTVEIVGDYSNAVFVVTPYRITAIVSDGIAEVLFYEKPGVALNEQLTGEEMEVVLSRNGGLDHWTFFDAFAAASLSKDETKKTVLRKQWLDEKRWVRRDGAIAVYYRDERYFVVGPSWYWDMLAKDTKAALDKL